MYPPPYLSIYLSYPTPLKSMHPPPPPPPSSARWARVRHCATSNWHRLVTFSCHPWRTRAQNRMMPPTCPSRWRSSLADAPAPLSTWLCTRSTLCAQECRCCHTAHGHHLDKRARISHPRALHTAGTGRLREGGWLQWRLQRRDGDCPGRRARSGPVLQRVRGHEAEAAGAQRREGAPAPALVRGQLRRGGRLPRQGADCRRDTAHAGRAVPELPAGDEGAAAVQTRGPARGHGCRRPSGFRSLLVRTGHRVGGGVHGKGGLGSLWGGGAAGGRARLPSSPLPSRTRRRSTPRRD